MSKNNSSHNCKAGIDIDSIYILDPKDCVFENGVFVRLKRKYGKFKRPVFKLNNK